MPAAREKSDAMPPKTTTGRKPTLSPTRIGTYLECAVKYRYIYQDKIGRFYTKARAGFSFGSTLHNVLQDFHEQGATHTPGSIGRRFRAEVDRGRLSKCRAGDGAP